MVGARLAVGLDVADRDPEEIDAPEGYELVDGGPLMRKPNGSSRMRILRWCPACNYVFDVNEDRSGHVALHKPEDFGLSPLGASR